MALQVEAESPSREQPTEDGENEAKEKTKENCAYHSTEACKASKGDVSNASFGNEQNDFRLVNEVSTQMSNSFPQTSGFSARKQDYASAR